MLVEFLKFFFNWNFVSVLFISLYHADTARMIRNCSCIALITNTRPKPGFKNGDFGLLNLENISNTSISSMTVRDCKLTDEATAWSIYIGAIERGDTKPVYTIACTSISCNVLGRIAKLTWDLYPKNCLRKYQETSWGKKIIKS